MYRVPNVSIVVVCMYICKVGWGRGRLKLTMVMSSEYQHLVSLNSKCYLRDVAVMSIALNFIGHNQLNSANVVVDTSLPCT